MEVVANNVAYELVRNDKDDTTWLLLDYEVRWGVDTQPRQAKLRTDRQSDKSDKLTLTATGTGDLAEFTSKLEPTRASFGFIRVKYANDEHSFREKFAFVTWIGEEVKIMRRAKVGCCGRAR